jgi:hypothetical protein
VKAHEMMVAIFKLVQFAVLKLPNKLTVSEIGLDNFGFSRRHNDKADKAEEAADMVRKGEISSPHISR